MKKKSNGFTLVELLAVIVILALIMILVIPTVLSIMESARKNSFYLYIESLQSKVEAKYQADVNSNSNASDREKCVVYNIEDDLDLESTGSFRGYVKVEKTAGFKGEFNYSGTINETVTDFKYCFFSAANGDKECTPDKSLTVSNSDGSVKGFSYSVNVTDSYSDNDYADEHNKTNYRLCYRYSYISGNSINNSKVVCKEHNDASKVDTGDYTYTFTYSIANDQYYLQNTKSSEFSSLEEMLKLSSFYKSGDTYSNDNDLTDCSSTHEKLSVNFGPSTSGSTIVVNSSSTNTAGVTKVSDQTTKAAEYVSTSSAVTAMTSEKVTKVTESATTSIGVQTITRPTASSSTTGAIVYSSKTTEGYTFVSTTTKDATSAIYATTSTTGTNTTQVTKNTTTGTKVKTVTYTTLKPRVIGVETVANTYALVTDVYGSTATVPITKQVTEMAPAVVSYEEVTVPGQTETYTQNVSVATTEEAKYNWVTTTIPEKIYDDVLIDSISTSPYSLSEEFESLIYYYTMVVPYNCNSVSIKVNTRKVADNIVVTINGQQGNIATIKNLEVGNNSVTIIVNDTATGNSAYYRINIDKMQSNGVSVNSVVTTTTAPGSGESGAPDPTLDESDATLKFLKLINGDDIDFSPEVTEYTVTLPEDVTSFVISAIPNSSSATVETSGNKDLKVGSEIKLKVISGNKWYTKTYTIKIGSLQASDSIFTKVIIGIIILLLILLLGLLLWWLWKKKHVLISSRDEDEYDYNTNQAVPDEAMPYELNR